LSFKLIDLHYYLSPIQLGKTVFSSFF